MLKALRDNILLPLLTRLGTAAGSLLMAWGVQQELAEQAILGVIALGLIAFDLVASYVNRRRKGQK